MSHSPVPRLGRTFAGLTAVAACSAGLLAAPAPASAAPGPARASGARHLAERYPNLAPRPPMGWNDWSYYMCDISEKVILDNARALVRSGLAGRGYRTVTVDDCWMSKQRGPEGELTADRTKFPHGMAYLGRKLHELGLKFGIYEDVGTLTCEKYPGSLGHFREDAELFARWKVDYVKADGCNVPVAPGHTKEETYRDLYGQMSRALRATGRPITFSVSAPAYFQYDGDSVWHKVIGWSAALGNLWRGGRDIALEKHAPAVKWSSILYNFRYNARLAGLQRPGRWNDPDFLLAGDTGLAQQEMQSQMSLWAMMAAPLISSTDLSRLSPAARKVLGNKKVIAVDQDALGAQGTVVQEDAGSAVLAKPLKNGDWAVALFNSGDAPRTLSVTAETAGLPEAGSYQLHDLVSGRRAHSGGTIVGREVPPHGTVLYRVTPD
ncbi:alpha-galactosidase [Streptomyces sp. 2224.1]|uniref:glycoside hydrolase family 27 protein n=1 Tax=unclassified Streptomyces TaxID=2593676 RepID=UPI000883B997|nr:MULTISPECIES: glycoside hydrolase family 27 protein [unclassified Streptomyces]PBC81030.1 alpha-galactosidase [Streptomyces sp. 2321.6]SDR56632.1 alpha-galactosidase [Streptomyces sp. KS_16]SEB98399.1 alpha-galactosidase [Streptomyces sp. 2133.1]SED28917.1 alpha-galactosidase [Streptomyces sp. 2224.1]SEF11015.1 alpha-galactosidase [Streptomyces sp. 2112.3]